VSALFAGIFANETPHIWRKSLHKGKRHGEQGEHRGKTGGHYRKRADIVSNWADTQVCPYVIYMGYDNPPLGQPHCGRCRQRPYAIME